MSWLRVLDDTPHDLGSLADLGDTARLCNPRHDVPHAVADGL
jgi:hypothetical protein